MTTRWTAPLALLSLVAAGACRDGSAPRDAAARDALQRDLELAQSSAVTLAPTVRDQAPTRFVSALEAGARPTAGVGKAAHSARRSNTKAPRAQAQHAPAPAAVALAAAAEEPQPAPAPAATEAAAESAPLIHEGESATPSDVGIASSGPGPYGGGGVEITRRGRGIGDAIGVVIRGGGVGDDDKCERDHPGSRMPYPMGRGGLGGIVMGVPRSGVRRGPVFRF